MIEGFKYKVNYYEDFPEYWTNMTGRIKIDGSQFLAQSIIFSFSIEKTERAHEILEGKYINFTFIQVVNGNSYVKKNYSYSYDEVIEKDYWLTMVYLSADEPILSIEEKAIEKIDSIYDYVCVHVSKSKYRMVDEIIFSMLNIENIIYEKHTPITIEV